MPFCTECGSPINPGDKFCSVCGTATQTNGVKSAAPMPPAAAPVTATVVMGTPHYGTDKSATKVSTKYAFAVVALCGLTATSFLIAGALTPVARATDGSGFDTTLYDISHADNACKKGEEKGNTALAFAIIAAIFAFGGTCTSAIGPLTSSRKLPFVGGIALAVASGFALIAGAVAVSIYTEPLCGNKSASSSEELRVGPGPILLMLSVLPLILGAVLSIVMRRPWTAEDEAAVAPVVADDIPQTVSKKYAFAVVALCGVVALPLLLVGALSPVFEGNVCPGINYYRYCVPVASTLLDVANDATCRDAKDRGGAGFGIAIAAAAAAAMGSVISAASPFSNKHNLPVVGGAFLGVGALCALVSGAVTTTLYTQDLCDGKSMSTIGGLNVGPAPILQMLAVLPLAGGFIAAMMMKSFAAPAVCPQIKFNQVTGGKKNPSVALIFASVVALALLIAAGTTRVYAINAGYSWYNDNNLFITGASPTLIQASKHSYCRLEATRATVALVFLIASGVGSGATLVLGYGALITGSSRLATFGGIGQCICGVLALIGGATAVSLFTTSVCYSGSISALHGAIRASPILLIVTAFVLLVGGLVALFSLRSKSARSATPGEGGSSQPLVTEQHFSYDTSAAAEAPPVSAV